MTNAESTLFDPVEVIASDSQARSRIRSQLDETLFVEAGAGTGKTTALVGRICELVLTDGPERVRLSSIAAITFTEAAAAELRQRIREEFEQKRRQAQLEQQLETVARCDEALADADLAAISTLHAFAQRLLSEFPVEVGIPPRVEVVDEVQSQLNFDDRWSVFVDSLFSDPDIEEFLVRASILDIGIAKRDSQLRRLAAVFDDNWDRLVGMDLTTPLAGTIDWKPLLERMVLVQQELDSCTAVDDNLYTKIVGLRLDRFIASGSDIDRMRRLKPLSDLKVSRTGRKPNWSGIDHTRELVIDLSAVVADLIGQLSNQTLRLLSARVAAFTLETAQQRRAEGELEFHDLLVLARQLLRTSSEARVALSQRYQILMLDEFQDTDPIQIELALLLASGFEGTFEGGWKDLLPKPGRLFMVGDPKQSIYRFRRADIELFQDAANQYDAGATRLSRNFRTVSPIIDAVNALFGKHMAADTGGQAKYAPLAAERQPSSADHRPLVLGGGMEGKAGDLRAAEADAVASTIASILSDPSQWPVLEKEVWRPAKLGDITILVPARTSLVQLTAALDEHGVAYRADTGTLVYETQEIRELLSVLSAIDDPTDQIALVAALRSAIYGCGDDDLFLWKQGGGSFELFGYIPDRLAESPVAEGIAHLRALSERRWWEEPSELLLRVIEERDVMAIAALGSRPIDSWRRIRYVVDQARAFSEAGGGDVRSYLRWARLQGAEGSRAHEPMLPDIDDDSVQIMTIHGSKGLEFPITFVSGLTTQARSGGPKGVQVLWPKCEDLPVGSLTPLPEVKMTREIKTKAFDVLADFEGEMDTDEKLRLLYVGLTRARDHLVLSGFHKIDKGKPMMCHGATIHEFAVNDASERFRLAGPSADQLEARDQSEQSDQFESRTEAAQIAASRAKIESLDVASAERQRASTWRSQREALVERSSVLPVQSATALAQAVTATREQRAVADDESWFYDEESEPQQAESANEQSLPPQTFRRGRAGSAIGSAVHAVLQLLDLTQPSDEEIMRLANAQAWAESVPEHITDIELAVRSALQAPIVASCRTARHWKEIFVAAPVGDITVEGYIDLLVETTDGLVVVDYKTDAVHSDAQIDAKLDHYSTQGAAYAMALESALGRPVHAVEFVFAQPESPVIRRVVDLDERRMQILTIASTA